MTVLDLGCGMGYFSVAMAEMVGGNGQVIGVDLQPEMLKVVSTRAKKAGLEERVRLHLCRQDELGLDVTADFILTFWMAHEVGRLESFMDEIYDLLKHGGNYFLAEPIGHVSAEKFGHISKAAVKAGFEIRDAPPVRFSRALVFGKSS